MFSDLKVTFAIEDCGWRVTFHSMKNWVSELWPWMPVVWLELERWRNPSWFTKCWQCEQGGTLSTVVFHSIRQGLWRITALLKFLFRHFQNLAVTRPKIRQYSAAGRKILPCWAFDHQTVSALEKNLHYKHYISAILEAVWRVTAELNEILQYAVDCAVPSQKLICTYANGRKMLGVAASGVCAAGGCGMILKSPHCSCNWPWYLLPSAWVQVKPQAAERQMLP